MPFELAVSIGLFCPAQLHEICLLTCFRNLVCAGRYLKQLVRPLNQPVRMNLLIRHR